MGNSQDYSSVGGALRLKGPSGIIKSKNKKKKKKKSTPVPSDTSSLNDSSNNAKHGVQPLTHDTTGHEEHDGMNSSNAEASGTGIEIVSEAVNGKTESQRKFDETRRKRLDQTLLKDSRSHKERVDAFNKYLANLSEHHDMPRIGPG